LQRVLRVRIFGGEADAPDGIGGAGLDEDGVLGRQKMALERFVLAELGEVAPRHQIEARRRPARLVEAAHAAAELLGLRGAAALQDSGAALLVAEQARLLRHHELLGAGVALAVDVKRAAPPLTEARVGDAAIGPRLMAPEQSIAMLAARSSQALDVED